MVNEAPQRMYVQWEDRYIRGTRFRTSEEQIEYIRADIYRAEVDALCANSDLDRLIKLRYLHFLLKEESPFFVERRK